MAGFNDLMIMMPLLYFMNQIDFTTEENLTMVRIAYAIAQALTLAVWGYIYTVVSQTKNTRKIRVPVGPTGFGQVNTETEEKTISEYDMSQVLKGLQQVGMGVLIVGFIHYKWNIVQPLFIQSFMTPMQLYKNPLFKIYVLGQKGEIENRPFKEENPLAAMMPEQPANDNQSEANTEQVTEQESEDNQNDTDKSKESNNNSAPGQRRRKTRKD